jgi:ABC-type transport system involved in multi-copper enzyme maturation permease subunit
VFLEIFIRETLESFTSRKLVSIALLCCTLIPLSVLVNQRAISNAIALQERARAEYERSLEGQKTSDEVEIKIFRTPSELAGLAAGLDPSLPKVAGVSQRGLSFGDSEVVDNPIVHLFGSIDLFFIVRFILSLIAISLSYNLICGEKELGTLRLILSNPVPRDSVLFGKVASAFATLTIPFALSLLSSLLILLVLGDRAVDSGELWARIGLFFLVSVLYLGVFVNLGAWISTLAGRSMTSMIVLLALWVGFVAVVPQTAGLVAATIYPVEDPQSFLLRKRLVKEDLERQRVAELTAYAGREDYDEVREPVAEKFAEQLQSTHARMDETYEVRRQSQRRITVVLALPSPASSFSLAATSLAGTGILQAEHFTSRLADFRREVHQQLFATSYRDLFLGAAGSLGGRLSFDLIDMGELPRFSYRPPTLDEVSAVIWPHVLVLALFNVVFFLLAFLRFRRYDVR